MLCLVVIADRLRIGFGTVFLALFACTFESSGSSDPAASVGEGEATTGRSSTSTDGSGEGDGVTTAASISAGGTGNAPATGTFGPGDTTEGPPRGDTTEGPPPGDTGEDTTGPMEPTEHVQNVPFTACERPLWCFLDGIFDGTGASQQSVECFTSTLTPPFAVTTVEYVVADNDSFGGDYTLRIYGFAGSGPGTEIMSEAVSSGSTVVGLNEHVLATPVTVQTPGFCVGFETPGGMELGFAVDEGTGCGSGTSYVSIDGGAGCNIGSLTEVCGLNPTPRANWCFGVDLVELPSG